MRKLARALGTTVDALVGTGADTAGRAVDVLVRRIDAQLRKLPLPVLDHVAAIVRELPTRQRRHG